MKTKSLFLSLASVLLLSACATGEPVDATPFTLGNDDAPVTIVEFSDLQCPACANISPQVEEFVKSNPSLARMEYKHFPLTQHTFAMDAAQAAECAGDQGEFWEYANFLFDNQSNFSKDFFYEAADELGLDRTAFDECYDSGSKRGKVLAHMQEGRALGVNSTPSLFINGEKVRFPGREALEEYVKSLVE